MERRGFRFGTSLLRSCPLCIGRLHAGSWSGCGLCRRRLRRYRCSLRRSGRGRGRILRFGAFAWFVLAISACSAAWAAYAVTGSGDPQQVAACQAYGCYAQNQHSAELVAHRFLSRKTEKAQRKGRSYSPIMARKSGRQGNSSEGVGENTSKWKAKPVGCAGKNRDFSGNAG
jgi:hypothetical protein